MPEVAECSWGAVWKHRKTDTATISTSNITNLYVCVIQSSHGTKEKKLKRCKNDANVVGIPLGCIICKYSIDARVCGIVGSVSTNKSHCFTSIVTIVTGSASPSAVASRGDISVRFYVLYCILNKKWTTLHSTIGINTSCTLMFPCGRYHNSSRFYISVVCVRWTVDGECTGLWQYNYLAFMTGTHLKISF